MTQLSYPPIVTSQFGMAALWPFVMPGQQVILVGAERSSDPSYVGLPRYETVKAALSAVRSDVNDVIAVLPGHAETIDSAWATNLKAGTTIVGLGDANLDNAPTFTWNATGSTIAVDVDNVRLANLRMKSTANGVTEGIGVTGDGFQMLNCWVQLATAATDEYTLFLDLEASADDCLIQGNRMFGVTGENTDVIKLSAAASRQRIISNVIDYLGDAAGTGAINVAAAVLQCEIAHNLITNRKAASTACIQIADVAATGAVHHNWLGTLADATGGTDGIKLAGTTSVLLDFYENYNCDGEKGKSALLSPAVQT